MQWGKSCLVNKWCWENWEATYKIIIVDCFLILYTKVNSKCIKHLNENPEIIKHVEENIGSILFDILDNIFEYVSLGKGNKSKNKQMELQ